MNAAQVSYVFMTVLFLVAAMVLFLENTAILAAVIFVCVAIFGFIVFTTMLMSDAGMTSKDKTGP